MNHSFIRPEPRDEEKVTLVSCQRRASEFEKRFCFDLVFKEKPGILYTFQALSEEDRRAWINAMDGAEPVSRNQNQLSTNSIILSMFIFNRDVVYIAVCYGI